MAVWLTTCTIHLFSAVDQPGKTNLPLIMISQVLRSKLRCKITTLPKIKKFQNPFNYWTVSKILILDHIRTVTWILVWPQWWSFTDVSQQGVDFSKKISKIKIFFWFDFHRDVYRSRQKVPKSDFQSINFGPHLL